MTVDDISWFQTVQFPISCPNHSLQPCYTMGRKVTWNKLPKVYWVEITNGSRMEYGHGTGNYLYSGSDLMRCFLV